MFPGRPICSLETCLIPGIGADLRGPDGAWGTQQMDVEKDDGTDPLNKADLLVL
jgi:hypothetical protein